MATMKGDAVGRSGAGEWIVPSGECQNVEFKETWQDEYLKWVCGFANAGGGVLYVGVRDGGEVCGVRDAKKLIEVLPNKIRDTMGLTPPVDLVRRNGADVVRVSVEAATFPVNLRGVYYLRLGATNQTLTGNALTQFILKRTGKTWDGVAVDGVSEEDLDKESFDIFRREAIRSGRISEDDLKLTRMQLLEHLNLVEDGKLKRAAVLLFHRNPEKWITGAFVKIGFFENDADLRYQDEIKGSLMIQADRVLDLIYTKYLKAEISYDNATRIERYPFPKDAVREAVFNALVHQDFAARIPVQISVYEDRLYVSNDCQFPADWTAETLLGKHRSRPLNPDVANAFFMAGFIESWGRGIEKIFRICRSHGIPEPEYAVHREDLMVCFRMGGAEVAQKDTEVAQKDTEVAQKDWEVAQKGAEVAQKGSEVAQKGAEVAQKGAEVAQKGGEVAQKGSEVAQKGAEVAQKGSEVAPINSEVAPIGPEVAPKAIESAIDAAFPDVRKDVRENLAKVFAAIAHNGKISIEEIAVETGVSERTVKNAQAQLKRTGLLVRVGGDRGGHWEVV